MSSFSYMWLGRIERFLRRSNKITSGEIESRTQNFPLRPEEFPRGEIHSSHGMSAIGDALAKLNKSS